MTSRYLRACAGEGRLFASSLGIVRAELWQAVEAAGSMRLAASWSAEPDAAFEALSRCVAFGPGEGLVGSVWSNGPSEVFVDLEGEARFVRGRAGAFGGAFGLRVEGDPDAPNARVVLLFTRSGAQALRAGAHARSAAITLGEGLGHRSAAAAGGVPSPAVRDTVVRVLLVDDHPALRTGLSRLLSLSDSLLVVAEAHDGDSAIRLAVQHEPDVVLMDLVMPSMTGIEATRALKAVVPEVTVIGFTGSATHDMRREMISAGAWGVLSKTAPMGALRAAITCALDGQPVPAQWGPWILDHSEAPTRPEAGSPLTDREREVVRWVALGKTSREAATLLGISARTVEKHRDNAMRKLGVHGAVGLTHWALRRGIMPIE